MKSNFKKIISMLIVAAVVLSSGFTTIPKPTPSLDNPIVIIEIEPDSDDGKSGNGDNEAEPQLNDSEDEIEQ